LVAIGVLSVLGGVVPATVATAQVVPGSDTSNPPLLPDLEFDIPGFDGNIKVHLAG
jgi:hypothetical protein